MWAEEKKNSAKKRISFFLWFSVKCLCALRCAVVPVCSILSILVRIRASVVGRAFAARCAFSTLHEVIRCCESTLIAQLWREKHNESHMRDTRSRPPARNSHHFATFYGYWAAQQMQSMSFDPEKKQLSSHDIHSYEMNCKIIQINLASRCVHYYVCHQPYAMACYLLSRSTVHTFFRTRTEKCLETNVRCAISTVGIIILFTAHHTFTLR